MLTLSKGDLLKADVDAVVNTVNTVGVMGKGIALQVKHAYPDVFKAYEAACKRGEVEIGRVQVVDRGGLFKPRFIFNFPTKRHWKEPSKLEYIRSGLKSLIAEIRERGIKSVAVPPLGCGHGGLNWTDVFPLIREAFSSLPTVEAHVFEPAGAPEASAMLHGTERPEMTPRRANVLRLLSEYCVLGYELTLLEVQKLLYFFQGAGEPLRLHFQKDKFGPYADNLRHVMNRFEGHFLQGYGDGQNKPDTVIQLLEAAVEEAREVSKKNSSEDERARLDRVLKLIEGFESPYGLELLATVHWVIAQEHAGKDPKAVISSVHAWNRRKRDMMKPADVEVATNRLAELNWI